MPSFTSSPRLRSVVRRGSAAAALLGLVAAPLALGFVAPAQAVPSSGLVISEVFGGNSATNLYNQDFVELKNVSGQSIDLAGKSVQYRSATGTVAPSSVVALSGKVPPGGHYLVGGAAVAGGTSIPVPDVTSGGMNLSGAAGTIFLANQATVLSGPFPALGSVVNDDRIIDLFGYGTSNTYETTVRSGGSTTNTHTRTGADTDNNALNFTVTTPGTPTNCNCVAPKLKIAEVYTDGGSAGATNDHDYVELLNVSGGTVNLADLTLQYRAPGATGAATIAAQLTGTVFNNGRVMVQLGAGGAEGLPVPGVDATGATELSTAGGTLLLVKGATGFDPGAGAFAPDQYVADLVGWGTSNVFEDTVADVATLGSATSLQRASGGVDTDNNATDFTVEAPTADTGPVVPVKTIPEIQGTGPTTPLPNANVSVSGVVTASYPNADGGAFRGFYLQTAGYDPASDATPNASDGIFVYTGTSTINAVVGNKVTLASAKVSEFRGMTELTVTDPGNVSQTAATPAEAVKPGTVLPGTDCALPGDGCLSTDALEAEREKHEGELFLPTAPYTVTDSYDGSPFTQAIPAAFAMAGEIGLAANSSVPLISPTQVANPTDNPVGLANRVRYNNAHLVVLDDGADVDYVSSGVRDVQKFPWLTPTHTVRMSAPVTFNKPVVFDYRDSFWRLQPQARIPAGDDGESQVSIGQNRPVTPEDVGGDVKIATFNVLNYFTTTGEAYVASGGGRTCTYYTDRQGARITNNTCQQPDPTPGSTAILPGPRGAANDVSLQRQQTKIVRAINTMDVDIMGLEEVENSIKLGKPDRDDALKALVAALNADWASAHPGDPVRWAFVPSPPAGGQPTVAEQDVIRSAFIYDPTSIQTQGQPKILINSTAFRNARQPLAQAFKAKGAPREDAFGVIVNHFKSKGGAGTGDNLDQGDGAGSYNGDRKRQSAALVAFADQYKSDLGIEAVFLAGDFNAYSAEDPVKVIKAGGYEELASDFSSATNDDLTYAFGGYAGSLDHVFANAAAEDLVTGADVYQINANEPIFYEYSRYNSNLADLYAANQYRASDHNPEIVGLDLPAVSATQNDEIQILGTNDFHGRLLENAGGTEAGAAALAGAVKSLRAENPDTVFAAAGDLIGGSTFESFIQHDLPTLDALNEAGLEVSSVGNHEFDAGYDDLVDRVMAPYDATTNPEGGADWAYLGANIRKATNHAEPALPETWTKTFNEGEANEIEVGFVGAVTEDLPSLVAGDGLVDIFVAPIVSSVNTAADQLEADGADLIVLLVHEGAATTAKSSVTDNSTFGKIVAGVDTNIDAIISGHTHLAYNHKVTVPAWVTEGRAVTERPVVSAGQYGSNLNQLIFEFDPTSQDLVDVDQAVLDIKTFANDPATLAIVNDAKAKADVLGAQEVGAIAGPFKRALRTDAAAQSGTSENRGGESTLGNLVAEVQRSATDADIAFMNPGGLRADMVGTPNPGYPAALTFRQAANVQPFANTLVNMRLTGAQLKTILEQQWQRDPQGNIPSRPFLRLGASAGFTYTYDPTRTEGDRITGMSLDGVKLGDATSYSVTANSFLASGTGDNFFGFAAATQKQDTGKSDLQEMVDYTKGYSGPVPVDASQRAVGVKFPAAAPAKYSAGDTLAFDLSSLAFTAVGDVQDSQVRVSVGGTDLGTFAVDNTRLDVPTDEAGTASVSVTVPEGVATGTTKFVVTGLTTGTVVTVPVATQGPPALPTQVTGSADDIVTGSAGSVDVTVTPATATGSVEVKDGSTVLGTGTLSGGATSVVIPAGSLGVGSHDLTLVYSGDATHEGSTGTVTVTVVKQSSEVSGTAADIVSESAGSVDATVTPSASTGTVEVRDGSTVLGTGTLSGGATSVVIPADSLPVGTHDLTLVYSGDGAHEGSTGSVTITVVKKSIKSKVSGTADDIVIGSAGAVEVAVTPETATGTVQVEKDGDVLGSASLTDGAATVALPAGSLPLGTHDLTLVYSGDGTHDASTDSVTVTVVKKSSEVSGTAADIVSGSAGSVDATVTPSASTGTVEVRDGSTVLGTGTLSGGATSVVIPADSLPVGTHDLTLVYSGDGAHEGSTGTVTVTVTKRSSQVSGTSAPIVSGTAGSVQVTVTPTAATGTVEANSGATVLGSSTLSAGQATVEIPAGYLPVGTHQVTLTYAGDATHQASAGSVTVIVTKASVTLSASVSPGSVAVVTGRAAITVSASSAGGVPWGTVGAYLGGQLLSQANLVNGSAMLPVGPFNTVGAKAIEVRYSGSDTMQTATKAVNLTVNKQQARLTVRANADAEQGKAGGRLLVTIDADGYVVTGEVAVTLKGNGFSQKVTLNNGRAEVILASLKKGVYEFTLRYLGDVRTETAQEVFRLQVKR